MSGSGFQHQLMNFLHALGAGIGLSGTGTSSNKAASFHEQQQRSAQEQYSAEGKHVEETGDITGADDTSANPDKP